MKSREPDGTHVCAKEPGDHQVPATTCKETGKR